MKILTRYILREVLYHALLGLALFTFVVFMKDVGRILEVVVRASASLGTVATMVLLTLPTALTVTIPMAVLVGILIGLSRLAADSEVTAMRAAGIGVWRFAGVILIFATVAWGIGILNGVWLAPWSAARLSEMQNELKTSQASYEVQPRVFYEKFKDYVLYVQDTQSAPGAAIWRGIFLADIRMPTAPGVILAERGIVLQEGPNTFRLHLTHGSQHESNPHDPEEYSITTFEGTDIPIQLPATDEPPPATRKELSTPELLQRSRQADDDYTRRYFLVEFHRRLALPTAGLVLGLVGIPLGLSAKKGGKSTGFILTIVLVFVYYFLSSLGVSLGRQGKVPPEIGPWLANLVFMGIGLVLLWRVEHISVDIPWGRERLAALKHRFHRQRRERPSALERALNRRRLFHARFPQILDDYVLREFLLYVNLVAAAFLVLTLVFKFFELLGDMVRNQVPMITVLEYLAMVVPSTLYEVVVPLSVLVAVLVTFALLEKSNEVTAMKATGISVYRSIAPVLAAAGVLAVGLFVFEQLYLPDINKRMDALLNTIEGKPAQTYLRPDRKWIFGQGSTIYYYEFFDPHQNRFGRISVFSFNPKTFEITRRVQAARAHWSEDLGKWVFEQGWVRSFEGVAIKEYENFDVATFPALAEPPSYFQKEVKPSSEMNYRELAAYIHDLQQSGFDVVRLRVQLHKKFAFPLITFVMAVLAVPFALSVGRKGALTGVALAIGLAVLYWMTAGLFEALGNVSQLPPAMAAWSPDLIFGLAGAYLILKIPT